MKKFETSLELIEEIISDRKGMDLHDNFLKVENMNYRDIERTRKAIFSITSLAIPQILDTGDENIREGYLNDMQYLLEFAGKIDLYCEHDHLEMISNFVSAKKKITDINTGSFYLVNAVDPETFNRKPVKTD